MEWSSPAAVAADQPMAVMSFRNRYSSRLLLKDVSQYRDKMYHLFFYLL